MRRVQFHEGSNPKERDNREGRFYASVSVCREKVTDEAAIQSLEQLHADLDAYRMRYEKSVDESMEFARHYTCR